MPVNRESPWVLGMATSHNGAVCLLKGDEIIVAIQEERLIRCKRSWIHASYGCFAIPYCLDYAGITVADLDAIVVCAPLPMPQGRQMLAANPMFSERRPDALLLSIPHHLGHAIAAFATSGFDEAAILVADGRGSPVEDLTPEERRCANGVPADSVEATSLYLATGTSILPLEKHFAAAGSLFGSLGRLYGAAGFQIFGDGMDGAGKVMGLAPYGKPVIPIDEFFTIQNGKFDWKETVRLRFQTNARWPEMRQEYTDLAASVQVAIEEALLALVGRLRNACGSENLCFTGGVALNSVANERIIREGGFARVFLQPAAEDSGTAIGAAYYGLWRITGFNGRRALPHDSVGRKYSIADIGDAIGRTPAIKVRNAGADVYSEAAEAIADGKITGWFEGGSELGPRALGHRSILCDPRRPEMKDTLNSRVKYREPFRPFAPVVLAEHAREWFDFGETDPVSPYMLRVVPVREEKRRVIPAITHIDGTARVQTATERDNPALYRLLSEFHRRTGVPVLLNTSFNVAGEPIVESPEDALWCLLNTGMDICVLEGTIAGKREGYGSILDLVFRLTTASVSAVYPVLDGRIQDGGGRQTRTNTPIAVASAMEAILEQRAQAEGVGYLLMRPNTPWGQASAASEAALLDVLREIDGERTGWQILDRLRSKTQLAPSEAEWRRLLGRLQRARVVAGIWPQMREAGA